MIRVCLDNAYGVTLDCFEAVSLEDAKIALAAKLSSGVLVFSAGDTIRIVEID